METFTKEVFGYISVGLLKCIITNENKVVAMGGAQVGNVLANVMLHCFSMNGDSLWTQLLADHTVTGWDLKLANDNGYVITGCQEFDFHVYKPYLIKTNSLGTITFTPEKTTSLHVQVYPNPATDKAIFHTPGIRSGILTTQLHG